MRAHGVPNFPDPKITGNTVRLYDPSSGVNPQSPAFQAAQSVCAQLLPKGPPGPGSPSASEEAALIGVSKCMRQHGVAGFPDPTTTAPSNRGRYSDELDRGGVFIAVPSTIDTGSPAFRRAAAVCHFGPRGI